jgi:hypothetical protein
MLVTTLVLVDKEHFGWLVGSQFLQIITGTLWVGALAVAVAAFKLRAQKTWHWIALLIWALIALISPVFGFLFLLPFGIIVLSSPVVIHALIMLWRPR